MGPLAEIDEALAGWLEAQPVFFVATAPLSAQGHVNVSPKGLDSFRVLGPREVAYLDLTGSGNETAAHLAENGRITLMFCAFGEVPGIVRLYGRGRVVRRSDPAWERLRAAFGQGPLRAGGRCVHPAAERQIVHVEVTRIARSCGFGVPRMAPAGEREALAEWAERKGPEGLREYRARRNRTSLDGLPAPDPDG